MKKIFQQKLMEYLDIHMERKEGSKRKKGREKKKDLTTFLKINPYAS